MRKALHHPVFGEYFLEGVLKYCCVIPDDSSLKLGDCPNKYWATHLRWWRSKRATSQFQFTHGKRMSEWMKCFNSIWANLVLTESDYLVIIG
jgi:hypothetical protein